MYATKFVPQQTRTALIERHRLLDQLVTEESHFNPPLGLIVAPSGYGKSTLMAQFMKNSLRLGDLVCWLSLDEHDNDEDTFITYLIESYQRAHPDYHVQAENSVSSTHHGVLNYPNTNPKMRLQKLLDLIAENGEATKIILDDFQELTSKALLENINWFLSRVPNNLSIYLVSKSEPELDIITELRAKNNILDIKANQLNFNLNELGLFLSSNKHINLEQQDLQALHQKTEGWIAATQLFSLALQNQEVLTREKQQSFIEELSGSDKEIVKYLSKCVFHLQSEKVKHFFLCTGILARFNADLCAAMCDDEWAADTLEYVSAQGLFIFELDRTGNWFRYHHLFREYLLTELSKSESLQYQELAMKAANWFDEHNDPEDAIDYYLLAEQYDKAAVLISDIVVDAVQYRGNHNTLLKWTDRLPFSYMLATPRVAICYAWSLLFTHDFPQSAKVIAELKQYQTESITDQKMISYNVEMLFLLEKVMEGDFATAREGISEWLQKWTDAPVFEQGVVQGLLGATCLHTLEFAVARKALVLGKSIFEKIHCYYGIAWIDSLYALVHWKQGHLLEAKRILLNGLEDANQKMGEHSFASSLINIKLSLIYCDLHENKTACDYLRNGFGVLDKHGVIDTAQIGFITKSRLLSRSDSKNKAFRALLDGERYGRNFNLNSFEVSITIEKVCLFLRNGEFEEAKNVFCESGFDDINLEEGSYTPTECMQISLLQARMALLDKEANIALDIINTLIKQCKQKKYYQLHDYLSLLLASTHYELGKNNQAFRILNEVIEAASTERKLGIFVDEKYHLKELMSEFIAKTSVNNQTLRAEKEKNFLAKLRVLFNIEPQEQINKTTSVDNKATYDVLTKREIELLSLLQQGLSNKELAESLFVSESTIKWHLSRVYIKLGAKNRLEAIKIFSNSYNNSL